MKGNFLNYEWRNSLSKRSNLCYEKFIEVMNGQGVHEETEYEVVVTWTLRG